jgi:hypothetical protein
MPRSIEFKEFPVPVYEWQAMARNKDGDHFGVSVTLRAPSADVAARIAHEAAIRNWKNCTFMSGHLVKYLDRT